MYGFHTFTLVYFVTFVTLTRFMTKDEYFLTFQVRAMRTSPRRAYSVGRKHRLDFHKVLLFRMEDAIAHSLDATSNLDV